MEGIKTNGYPLFKSKSVGQLFDILCEDNNVKKLNSICSKNPMNNRLADLIIASDSNNEEKAELSMKALSIIYAMYIDLKNAKNTDSTIIQDIDYMLECLNKQLYYNKAGAKAAERNRNTLDMNGKKFDYAINVLQNLKARDFSTYEIREVK